MRTPSIFVAAALAFASSANALHHPRAVLLRPQDLTRPLKRDSLPLPNCTPATKFFTQKLDHQDASNTKTWQQQYQIITDYYKPGGPIFFFQGEEATRLECVESTTLVAWAKQTGGIAAALEHRFFGQSLPLGSDSETVAGLKYLTLENVIGDAEEFVKQVKANFTGASTSKVAVISGSYGGFLMVMFRQNSAVFDAVVASASPVRSFGLNPPNHEDWLWWNYTSHVYSNNSAALATKIEAGFAAFEDAFNNNPKSLVSQLGWCTPPVSGVPFLTYSELIAEIFMVAAELNYPSVQDGRAPLTNSFDTIKNKVLAASTPLQAINESIWAWYGPILNGGCFDPLVNSSNIVPLIEVFPFHYIFCTYLPISSENIPNGTIFPANPDSFNGDITNLCSTQYNITSIPSEAQLQAKYHFTPAELLASTGIIFSTAGFDPTTAVSVPSDFPSRENDKTYASRRFFRQDMGHRQDLFAEDPSDQADVIALRALELQTIQNWFKL